MSVLLKDNPAKKQEYIISLAASGKSNKEIAEELGYKNVHNLYTFMRRRGMVWNANKGLYVVKGEKEEEPKVIEEKPSRKVGSIISMFDKKTDGKEIAKSLRFGSYQEMADYMKSKGYVWDNKRGNYIKTVAEVKAEPAKEEHPQVEQTAAGQVDNNGFMEEYGDILRLLKANKDRLSEMLAVAENAPNIPRYTLPGYNITKSIDIPSPLDQLIKDFSRDKSVSQREIIQVALVELLKKYGYAEEVKTVLHI